MATGLKGASHVNLLACNCHINIMFVCTCSVDVFHHCLQIFIELICKICPMVCAGLSLCVMTSNGHVLLLITCLV